MAPAQSLRDLLRIRRRHARWLRSLPGYLGSAVGYKYREDSGTFARDADGALIPAVLVFVTAKRDARVLRRRGQLIPATLEGPNQLGCATDVVRGTLPRQAPAPVTLVGSARRLQRSLHVDELPIVGGIPLTSDLGSGTAACLVRSTAPADAGQLGVLTNWHVAGLPGNELFRPPPRLQLIGTTRRTVFTARRGTSDGDDLESFTDGSHRLDAGFVAIPAALGSRTAPGVHHLGALGPPHVVNLDTMDLVGRSVVSLGATLGLRRGLVAAYGYEWSTESPTRRYATDYLLLGADGGPFAAPGDSGKLVITDDEQRIPVALLWGGERQTFWTARAQESWSYASAIRLALEALEVELADAATSAEPRPARPRREAGREAGPACPSPLGSVTTL